MSENWIGGDGTNECKEHGSFEKKKVEATSYYYVRCEAAKQVVSVRFVSFLSLVFNVRSAVMVELGQSNWN